MSLGLVEDFIICNFIFCKWHYVMLLEESRSPFYSISYEKKISLIRNIYVFIEKKIQGQKQIEWHCDRLTSACFCLS